MLDVSAHAGHWVLTTTGSGKAGLNGGQSQTFTPPGPATNSVTTGGVGAGAGIGPTFGNGIPSYVSASASLSVTVTGTWTTDTTSDNTTPPGVTYSETSTANASSYSNGGPSQPGTASDGLGDPINQSGLSTTSKPKYVKASGGSFTVSLTLSASAKGTAGLASAGGGGAGASAGCGPITIAVHAQPYNFHKVPGAGKKLATGEIDWVYAYSSTDGNIQDLTSCKWHEHLTYPGGAIRSQSLPNGYYPPNPPFGAPAGGYNNPTFSPAADLAPQLSLTSTISDATLVPPFAKPYFHGTFTTTQVFEFDDSATGGINTQIPGPDSGPFNIVRTVNYIGPSNYEYDVTKDSISDSLSLPN